ncbi:MAG: glycosyltransferase, partial [Pyrinomonadaceae bacterium]
MAAGCPVIATATDGAKELMIDETAIVPIRDPLALADKISWFLVNHDERRLLGEKQQSTAHEKFGLAAMVDATENLYRKILER